MAACRVAVYPRGTVKMVESRRAADGSDVVVSKLWPPTGQVTRCRHDIPRDSQSLFQVCHPRIRKMTPPSYLTAHKPHASTLCDMLIDEAASRAAQDSWLSPSHACENRASKEKNEARRLDGVIFARWFDACSQQVTVTIHFEMEDETW